MINKQNYFMRASFAFLIFVILGYSVKFYPESLAFLDIAVQEAVRGNLPDNLTEFFKFITIFGNVLTQFGVVILVAGLFLIKRWRTEALFLITGASVSGLAIVIFKLLYKRTRPEIEHLVHAGGFSFPSGHSLGSMVIYGIILIVIHERVTSKGLRWFLECIFALLILLIGLSRIYLGVHFPTDVLAGFIIGYALLNVFYPYYVERRFKWRFQSRQD
ncbi:phosphatase PAP2 family protein [Streptococcus didelphis]|uniref:Phosphatase PAP2 family protein n=1 Tax=Streptococcus didelphis TaxID=102886 RepID=A0ABY9LID8_9STRE|nr:phosphatase PAP2 family protein [Streptococcus didelphis]WMB28555.1 phosphatase PAP2 family protein [Streptococcus didelphis]WMB29228.1 phosphatase PAP2 family protein [Streptococcus didelphis]